MCGGPEIVRGLSYRDKPLIRAAHIHGVMIVSMLLTLGRPCSDTSPTSMPVVTSKPIITPLHD